jgi:hypothetical protein
MVLYAVHKNIHVAPLSTLYLRGIIWGGAPCCLNAHLVVTGNPTRTTAQRSPNQKPGGGVIQFQR